MAIPGWLWPGEQTEAASANRPALDHGGIEAASETFDALSDPARLEILTALYDRDEPVPYTELREETSVEDNGRFNYHLRRLGEEFVAKRNGGYALTDRGTAVLAAAVGGDSH